MNYYLLQSLLILSLIVYFIFDAMEDRRVQDEREDLIRLKTHRFVQRVSTWTLVALSLLYIYDRDLAAIIYLLAMVLASLYAEMLGRLYWRRHL